jgi:glycosyltransferase involved in cell wall biosynthesis
MHPTVSVLMATYDNDQPAHFAQALETVFNQTRAPEELVLVVDGPIRSESEQVINEYRDDPRIAQVKVHRLAQNYGLAHALNAGLILCEGEWIARMDSDDLALTDRIQVQLDYAEEHPDADVIGSWCEEFSDERPGTRIKSSPITHGSIVSALKWRNVLVHPTIMVRTAILRRFNGYRTNFEKLEDYDLFVRLVLGGARFCVIPKALVKVRVGSGMMVRRGGLKYCWNEIRFRTFCWRSGLLNIRQFIASTLAYLLFRLSGAALRGYLYGLMRVSGMGEEVPRELRSGTVPSPLTSTPQGTELFRSQSESAPVRELNRLVRRQSHRDLGRYP